MVTKRLRLPANIVPNEVSPWSAEQPASKQPQNKKRMWLQRGQPPILLFALLYVLLCQLCLHQTTSDASPQWHKDGLEEVRCPLFVGNGQCHCEAASDGLDFRCDSEAGSGGTKLSQLRAVISAARFAIKTLTCLLYTSPSPRDRQKSRMPSSA